MSTIGNVSGSSPLDPLYAGAPTSDQSTNNDYTSSSLSSSSASANTVSFLSFSPTLPPPAPSEPDRTLLNTYLSLLSSSKNALLDQLNTFEVEQRQIYSEMIGATGAWAVEQATALKQITDIYRVETSIYRRELNASLSYNVNVVGPYNDFLNSMSSITNAMYQAQLNYKNGTISNADYNAIVAQWNIDAPLNNSQIQAQYDSYAAATLSYNNEVAAINVKIQELNALRRAQGISGNIPLLAPASLLGIQYLTTSLPFDPILGQLPSVAASFQTASETSQATGISIAISLSNPVLPEDQAIADAISQNLQSIATLAESYNRELVKSNAQVALMNQAISDFYNGTIDQATYDGIVSAYVAYATNANNQLSALASNYLASLNAYNSYVTTIMYPLNTQIPLQSPLDIPPLASLLLPTAIPSTTSPPAVNPLLSGPFVQLPSTPTGTATPTKLSAYLNKYFTPIAEQQAAAASIAYINLLNAQEQIDYKESVIRGRSKLVPLGAEVAQPSKISTTESVASVVSGVGLSVLALGIDSPALMSVITQSLQLQTSKLLADKIPPAVLQKVTNQTLAFTLSILQEAILSAVLPALKALEATPAAIYPGSPALDVALSIAILSNLKSLIASEGFTKAVSNYLAGGDFTPEQMALLQKSLSTGAELGSLLLAATITARTLKLPGLLAQLLGSQQNADSAFRQQVMSTLNNNFSQVFDNPEKVSALKLALADSLRSRSAVDYSMLQSQINRAIENSRNILLTANSNEALRQALSAEFSRQNFDVRTSLDLAQTAFNFIQGQLLQQDIQAASIRQSINQSRLLQNSLLYSPQTDGMDANQVQNIATANNFTGAIVADQLRAQAFSSALLNESINKDQLLKALNDSLKQIPLELRVASNIPSSNQLALNPVYVQPSPDLMAAVNQALDATLAQRLASDFQFRVVLTQQLNLAGVATAVAEEIAARAAAIVASANSPLESAKVGIFLTAQDFRSELKALIESRLVKDVDLNTARALSERLTYEFLGEEIKQREFMENKVAVVDLLNRGYVESQIAYTEGNQERQIENYQLFLFQFLDNKSAKLAVDINTLAQRLMDPAYRLLDQLASPIFAQDSRWPSNYKRSIDIPA